MRAIVFALCREDENVKPHWETQIEATGVVGEEELMDSLASAFEVGLTGGARSGLRASEAAKNLLHIAWRSKTQE